MLPHDSQNSSNDLWSSRNVIAYHTNQWDQPKQQTIEFTNFISKELRSNSIILDLGCGGGGATYFIAKKFPEVSFLGVDQDVNLINLANKNISNVNAPKNIKFKVGNFYALDESLEVNGVICLQTLSWLSGYENFMKNVYTKLSPDWFAVTSLFYQGDITAETKVTEHRIGRTINYNTYSIPQVEKFSLEFDYKLADLQKFDIGFDIAQPKGFDRMGTYTKLIIDGKLKKRIQISGPLLMNWYFLLFKKSI